MRKKISAVLLILLFLALAFFAACSGSSRQVNTSFDNFTNELFRQEVSANAITVHYTLKDPEAYGIHDVPETLGSYSTDGYSAIDTVENCLAALKKFR